MTQYLITDENLAEMFEYSCWGVTNFQKKGLLKFWKERGIDTKGLEGKKNV